MENEIWFSNKRHQTETETCGKPVYMQKPSEVLILHSNVEHLLSQAAACDGTRITTPTTGQEIMPGTLPTF